MSPTAQVSDTPLIHSAELDRLLPTFLGKRIEDVCSAYNNIKFNHCAHFVSHVLQLRLPHAALCTNVGDHIVYANRKNGFCVRVDQVFNSCDNRRYLDESVQEEKCFIVATLPDNIKTKDPLVIGDHSKKHIGIILNQKIYNFSNTHKVVMTRSIEEFKKLYGAHTVVLRADLPA